MTIRKLNGHNSAQATVYENGNQVDLISYITRVITVKHENGKRMIECTGLYSRTTIKHIGWFCREYLPDLTYYDIKNIVGKGFVAI